MTTGRLEHANISVTDPERSAALLRDLLGWEERWRGPSQKYGRSVHVGGRHDYIALYTGEHVRGGYAKGQPLNHLAFTVDDLDAAEAAVTACSPAPLYARVDLVRLTTGQPAIMELELVEPELFFRFGPGAADRLAEAVKRLLG